MSDQVATSTIKQSHGDQLSPAWEPVKWVHDRRIGAVMVAAPAVAFTFGRDGLRGIAVPVQLWRAEDDRQAPDGWNSRIVREGLLSPPEEHIVRGAGHMAFRPCDDALARAVAWICHDAPGFDRAAFHVDFNRAVVAFFRKQLQ